MRHKKAREMEYPPAPLRQLSPKNVNDGIQGIMWAIGVLHNIPESGRSFLRKNFIS
jgi:hypothetical protein